MRYLITIIVMMIFLQNTKYFGQCSDAGICSIDNGVFEEKSHNHLEIEYSYGISGDPDSLTINALKLSTGIQLPWDTKISLSVPFQKVSGPFGSVSGIGDLILILTHSLYFEKNSLSISGGIKFNTGADDIGNFPQKYQPGLGSTDFLFGIHYNVDNYYAGFAYQNSGKRNSNILQMERGDDIMLKLGHFGTLGYGLDYQIDALAIKRLKKSSIISPEPTISRLSYYEISGSDNFQINLSLKITKTISEKIRFSSILAFPTLKREDNTDGLQRALTINLAASYTF